MGSKFGISH